MNSAWQAFLAGQGAGITPGQPADFPAPAAFAADDNVLVDLSHLALAELSGDDAVAFLQGQVTNDVRLLDGGRSHYAGYCTPKGRLLALFLAFSHDNRIYLQFNGALREPILKRLKMYVLRSKVSIVDASDATVRLGVAGAAAAERLQQLFGQVPAEPHQLLAREAAMLLRLPGATPRFEIIAAPEQAPRLWQALAEGFLPVGAARWEWLEIQAGLPDIMPPTQEAFVPQMVNLDLLGGINFKKGCYTGQEIVARTHYLGKVKRRTQLAHATVMAQPGEPVYAGDSTEAVGMVVRAAAAPQGGCDLLLEARLESVEAGGLRLGGADGAALELRSLPYRLD